MPQVTARELVCFLRAQGFAEDRQSGSHLTLWHEGRKLSVLRLFQGSTRLEDTSSHGYHH
jgi:predicted RNA binding protein YcfA (HicA-like mRNA interferase family)